jgi:hypothetical protein
MLLLVFVLRNDVTDVAAVGGYRESGFARQHSAVNVQAHLCPPMSMMTVDQLSLNLDSSVIITMPSHIPRR